MRDKDIRAGRAQEPSQAEGGELSVDQILREFGSEGARTEGGGEDAPVKDRDPQPAPEEAERTENPSGDAPDAPEEQAGESSGDDFPNLDDSTALMDGDDDAPEDEKPREGRAERPARRERRALIPRGLVLLILSMVLAVALVCAAVLPDLEDPAWSIMVIAGLVIACVPMAMETFRFFRNRDGVPTGLVMLAAAVIFGCSGALVEAAVSAAIYNVSKGIFNVIKERELSFVKSRITALRTDGEGPLGERLDVTIRELDSARIKPVVDLRRYEWTGLLAALCAAVIFSVIPPLFDGMDFLKWIGRGAVVLTVCVFSGEAGALMTYVNGVESAIANTIWFSDAGTVYAASEITSVLFNKTGTLTKGQYKVTAVDPVRISQDQLLYLAVQAGAYSDHALDRAIREYSGLTPDKSRITVHKSQEGYGCVARLDGDTAVAIGNIDFMERLGVKGDLYIPGETCVFVAVGRTCVGRIDFSDTIVSDAITVVHDLKNVGVPNVALMTGDNALSATNLGRRVGITEIYSDCRPRDKSERLQYIQESQMGGERAAFVSSAGNDRELLELANLSVTLGVGPEATGTFPDVVIASGELSKLAATVRIAKDIRRKLTISAIGASVVRGIAAVLAVTGVLSLWSTVLVMIILEAAAFMNTNISVE